VEGEEMMKNLGILIAVAAAAVACGEARETSNATTDQPQTFNEAASDLADDVQGDVSAGADQATDEAKKQAEDSTEDPTIPDDRALPEE
jgi:hypothetical protein